MAKPGKAARLRSLRLEECKRLLHVQNGLCNSMIRRQWMQWMRWLFVRRTMRPVGPMGKASPQILSPTAPVLRAWTMRRYLTRAVWWPSSAKDCGQHMALSIRNLTTSYGLRSLRSMKRNCLWQSVETASCLYDMWYHPSLSLPSWLHHARCAHILCCSGAVHMVKR